MAACVLVDTSAIVGLFIRGDEWHRPAREAFEELKARRRRLLSTSDIFDEAVTAIRKWAGHEKAVAAGEILRRSALIKILGIEDETREEAWGLFKKYDDQELSLTDCTSFVVMEKFGIREAFTFDEDFRKVGYTVLPGKEISH